MAPKVKLRLGLTYEELGPLNPRLIYTDITGYGASGPEADKPCFDNIHLMRRRDDFSGLSTGECGSPLELTALWRNYFQVWSKVPPNSGER